MRTGPGRHNGYRLVTQALGRTTVPKTVLMAKRQKGPLCADRRRRKCRPYADQAGKAAPNLPRRNFGSGGPTRKPAAGVTELEAAGAMS